MTDIALDETPAEEFSRLVIEYNEGERQHRAEAWNLIADFALEHCGAILRGLSASPSQVAPANPAQVTEEMVDVALLTAAIGACGQAVAWRWRTDEGQEPDEWLYGPDKPSDNAIGRQWKGWQCEPLFTLSQPHPADERVVEALREAADRFDEIRVILIKHLEEPQRTAFWKAVNGREFCRHALTTEDRKNG